MKYMKMMIGVTLGLTFGVNAASASDLIYGCEKFRPHIPYKGTIPKTFHLVHYCPDAKVDDYMSQYSFVGDATVRGIVTYEDTYTFGSLATFSVDEGDLRLLPTLPPFNGREFKFDKDPVRDFRLPPLAGEGKNCWKAPAQIRIKRIYDLVDDSDFAGAYLVSYTVIRTGSYSGCRAETDPTPEQAAAWAKHKKARKVAPPVP